MPVFAALCLSGQGFSITGIPNHFDPVVTIGTLVEHGGLSHKIAAMQWVLASQSGASHKMAASALPSVIEIDQDG